MSQTDTVFLTRRQQASRYQRSVRTIERWGDDPELGYPPEIDINGHRLRRESDLERWERERAAVAPGRLEHAQGHGIDVRDGESAGIVGHGGKVGRRLEHAEEVRLLEDPATETATDSTAPQAQSWRDTLPIHPAAALFPRMSSDELRELGKDIRKNGLRSSIALWQSDKGASALLLDGISRLDAVEVELGRPVRVVPRTYRRTRWSLETDEDGESVPVTNLIGEAGNTTAEQQTFILLGRDADPWAYVTSANLHRRHLTAEQRRELIGKLIEAMPEKSNRQIAKLVNASPTTVGTRRAPRWRRPATCPNWTRRPTPGAVGSPCTSPMPARAPPRRRVSVRTW